jgi:hypothetical protein
MIPPSSRSFSLPSRPRAFLVGLLVAATFGAGGGPELFAQQSAPGPTPRRAESSARTSKQGQRAAATASNASAKRGAQGGASGAATTAARGRSPAVALAAASGVRQTSATVSADGGVVLAGGALASADCRQCGRQDCGKCRPVGDRLGLHCNGLCEQGGCPAHCPVRPDQFGYYATRWRSWPGQGVKQVGHFDPATTPVVPPRSEVPGMEDELALPSQRDEAAPDAEEEEEEEEEAMADAEDDTVGKDDAAAGDAKPAAGADGASGSEGGLPEGGPSAPGASESKDTEAKSGDKDAVPTNVPAKASGPRDVPLETSGAEAARPAGALTDSAWSNWSRSSLADPKQAPPGSVVRTSGPAETTEVEGSPDDRRDGSKLRSPAQRMVEGSERAVGRWRAKAAASAEASSEAAANPLRGVTAQPGNPLR